MALVLPIAACAIPRLTPMAQSDRDSGLQAAKKGDWAEAVRGLQNARDEAYFDPGLMYDLGLADEKAGDKAPAALWWRAYLTAVPRAANAAAVSAEIDRLAAELEASARQKYRQAVALAWNLPAQPAVIHGKSLRRKAFDAILEHARFFGPADMEGAISAEALAAQPDGPGAKAGAGAADDQGLWGLTFALCEKRALSVRRALGGIGRDPVRDGMVAAMYAHLGDAANTDRWLAGYDGEDLVRALVPEVVVPALIDSGAYSEAQALVLRLLQTQSFHADILDVAVHLSESAFWNGRRDVTEEVAGRSLSYYETRPVPAHDRAYQAYARQVLLLQALVGNWDSVDAMLRGNHELFEEGTWWVTDRVAGIVAATAPKRALDLVPLIYDELRIGVGPWSAKKPDSMSAIVRKLHAQNPIGDVALAFAKGDDATIRRMLRTWAANPTNYDGNFVNFPHFIQRTLELAVARNKPDIAFEAARSDLYGNHVAAQMRVFAGHADGSTRRRIEDLLGQIRGGHPQFSPERERRLRARIDLALAAQYSFHAPFVAPDDLEDRAKSGQAEFFIWWAPAIAKQLASAAKKTPERLPRLLSEYGAIDYVAALAARGPKSS